MPEKRKTMKPYVIDLTSNNEHATDNIKKSDLLEMVDMALDTRDQAWFIQLTDRLKYNEMGKL